MKNVMKYMKTEWRNRDHERNLLPDLWRTGDHSGLQNEGSSQKTEKRGIEIRSMVTERGSCSHLDGRRPLHSLRSSQHLLHLSVLIILFILYHLYTATCSNFIIQICYIIEHWVLKLGTIPFPTGHNFCH